uniref:Uncharacterized protein n=1 Tax=Anguilla anguilla TaxID=7936 RepID=A0A0E9RK87_ANGAN
MFKQANAEFAMMDLRCFIFLQRNVQPGSQLNGGKCKISTQQYY